MVVFEHEIKLTIMQIVANVTAHIQPLNIYTVPLCSSRSSATNCKCQDEFVYKYTNFVSNQHVYNYVGHFIEKIEHTHQ